MGWIFGLLGIAGCIILGLYLGTFLFGILEGIVGLLKIVALFIFKLFKWSIDCFRGQGTWWKWIILFLLLFGLFILLMLSWDFLEDAADWLVDTAEDFVDWLEDIYPW